jgi:hypothetical protein
MRRTGWLALALIAPALAACGGDSEDTSTPADKPALTVPGESTAESTETETDTESTETSPGSGDTGSTTGPMDQPNPGNGGVPAPDNNPPADQQPEDSPSNDTPPEPGSPADRFEQFCAQNPGAC